MKTRIFLLTIGAAVLAAITINVSAGNALLSPRAADNQTKIVPAVANEPNLAVANQGTISPRAAGNQVQTVSDTEILAAKCPVIGSPKYVATAGNAARTSCCKMTVAECPTVKDCCNAK